MSGKSVNALPVNINMNQSKENTFEKNHGKINYFIPTSPFFV